MLPSARCHAAPKARQGFFPSRNVQTPVALRARLRSHRPSGTFRNRLQVGDNSEVPLRLYCNAVTLLTGNTARTELTERICFSLINSDEKSNGRNFVLHPCVV